MFWNVIVNSIAKKNKISFYGLKEKTTTWYANSKLKIIFNKYGKIVDKNKKTVGNFLKNKKYSIFLKTTKIDYTQILFKKENTNMLQKNDSIFFYLILRKKQTYINVCFNKKKIIHITNGISLKKNSILEKSRKKEIKTSLLSVTKSIELCKQFLKKNKISGNIFINIKKIKPFINKLSRLIWNEIKPLQNRIIFTVTPSISFFSGKFKKIKSIKRRLRKKYKTLDI